ncbi:LytR C-terminal domain-containing protein [Streptomyces poonensis]|uniref:Membrane protein n=1 Tax=Streptomyces poonensis TaxID=68255 RepID=A0A918PXJ0_9ACTN|nr:LytR C-terminal domain-containing protein [Streptomyces poonensis]GGZ24543.1 membrane protein [Streptomyces poonensis]GLJ89994.1 membrane protein [Streptomyces poonensis]
MSMLTPPGMGGEYRITGDKYPRMRRPKRRPRLVLVIVASVVVAGLISWGTLQLIDVFSGGDNKTVTSTKPSCMTRPATRPSPTPAAKSLPKPAQITVNVFNATPRSGLAKETADGLKKRGFRIGEVANASKEYDKKVPGTAVLLGAKSATGAALPVLGTQLRGADLKTDSRAKATEVDFIIGNRFKSLSTKADADKALAALTAPRPTPTPSC